MLIIRETGTSYFLWSDPNIDHRQSSLNISSASWIIQVWVNYCKIFASLRYISNSQPFHPFQYLILKWIMLRTLAPSIHMVLLGSAYRIRIYSSCGIKKCSNSRVIQDLEPKIYQVDSGRDLTQSCDKCPLIDRKVQKATWQLKNDIIIFSYLSKESSILQWILLFVLVLPCQKRAFLTNMVVRTCQILSRLHQRQKRLDTRPLWLLVETATSHWSFRWT